MVRGEVEGQGEGVGGGGVERHRSADQRRGAPREARSRVAGRGEDAEALGGGGGREAAGARWARQSANQTAGAHLI